jgi:hypothetical protein
MDRRKQLEQSLDTLAAETPHLYAMTLVRALQGEAEGRTRTVMLGRLREFAQSAGGQGSEELRRFSRSGLAYTEAQTQENLQALVDLGPTLTHASMRLGEVARLRATDQQREEAARAERRRARERKETTVDAVQDNLEAPKTRPPQAEKVPPAMAIVLHGEHVAIEDLPRLKPRATEADRDRLLERLGDMPPRRLLALRLATAMRVASLASPKDASEAREAQELHRGMALATRAIEARGIEVPKEFDIPQLPKGRKQTSPDLGR